MSERTLTRGECPHKLFNRLECFSRFVTLAIAGAEQLEPSAVMELISLKDVLNRELAEMQERIDA